MLRFVMLFLIVVLGAGCVGEQANSGDLPDGFLKFDEITSIGYHCHKLHGTLEDQSDYPICPDWETYAYAGSLSVEGMILEKRDDSMDPSPVIHDLDKDGSPEIIASFMDMLNKTRWTSFVLAIDVQGNLVWKFETDALSHTTPRIVDIDADGSKEIIFGTDNGTLHVIGPDGTPHWTYQTNAPIRTTPTITDINKDGTQEVIFASDGIYLLDGKGELTNFTIYGEDKQAKGHYYTEDAILATPVIADLDLDGNQEIITITSKGREVVLSASRNFLANNPGTVAFKEKDNEKEPQLITIELEKNSPYSSSPAIANIDQDPYPDRIYLVLDKIKNKNNRQTASAIYTLLSPSVKPMTAPAINMHSTKSVRNTEEATYHAEYLKKTKEIVLTLEMNEEAYLMQYDGILSELEKEKMIICKENEKIYTLPQIKNGCYSRFPCGSCSLNINEELREDHEMIFMKEKIEKNKQEKIRIPVESRPVSVRVLIVKDLKVKECERDCEHITNQWYSLENVKYVNMEIN